MPPIGQHVPEPEADAAQAELVSQGYVVHALHHEDGSRTLVPEEPAEPLKPGEPAVNVYETPERSEVYVQYGMFRRNRSRQVQPVGEVVGEIPSVDMEDG